MSVRCGSCDHLVTEEHGGDGRCLVDYPWACNCPGAGVALVYDDSVVGDPDV